MTVEGTSDGEGTEKGKRKKLSKNKRDILKYNRWNKFGNPALILPLYRELTNLVNCFLTVILAGW